MGGGGMCPGGWGGGYAPGGWSGGGWGGWTGGLPPGGGVPGEWLNPPPPGGVPAGNGDNAAWDLLVDRLVELIDAILEGLGRQPSNAQPFGTPPQVDNVHLVRESGNAARYQVLWEVSGDRSQVKQYTVSLWQIRLEATSSSDNRSGPEEFLVQEVATDVITSPDLTASSLAPEGPVDPTAWLQPIVVAEMQDSSTSTEMGAALPWLPPDATSGNQPVPVAVQFPDSEGRWSDPRPIATEPGNPDSMGAWTEPVVTTPRGVSLASDGLTHNCVVQLPQGGNFRLRYSVEELLDPTRDYQLIAHVVPLDENGVSGSARIETGITGPNYEADIDDSVGNGYDRGFQNQAPDLPFPVLLIVPLDMSSLSGPGRVRRLDVFNLLGRREMPTKYAVYGLRLVPVER